MSDAMPVDLEGAQAVRRLVLWSGGNICEAYPPSILEDDPDRFCRDVVAVLADRARLLTLLASLSEVHDDD